MRFFHQIVKIFLILSHLIHHFRDALAVYPEHLQGFLIRGLILKFPLFWQLS